MIHNYKIKVKYYQNRTTDHYLKIQNMQEYFIGKGEVQAYRISRKPFIIKKIAKIINKIYIFPRVSTYITSDHVNIKGTQMHAATFTEC